MSKEFDEKLKERYGGNLNTLKKRISMICSNEDIHDPLDGEKMTLVQSTLTSTGNINEPKYIFNFKCPVDSCGREATVIIRDYNIY